MTIQKILKQGIVHYISRHCFYCFVFDTGETKSQGIQVHSLIIKEKNDKKGGWFNLLFQTFKTIAVVVVCGATEFSRAFSYE